MTISRGVKLTTTEREVSENKQIVIIIIALILIGWRMTVTKGTIEIDKANNHIGYFTVFGQTDEYYKGKLNNMRF